MATDPRTRSQYEMDPESIRNLLKDLGFRSPKGDGVWLTPSGITVVISKGQNHDLLTVVRRIMCSSWLAGVEKINDI